MYLWTWLVDFFVYHLSQQALKFVSLRMIRPAHWACDSVETGRKPFFGGNCFLHLFLRKKRDGNKIHRQQHRREITSFFNTPIIFGFVDYGWRKMLKDKGGYFSVQHLE